MIIINTEKGFFIFKSVIFRSVYEILKPLKFSSDLNCHNYKVLLAKLISQTLFEVTNSFPLNVVCICIYTLMYTCTCISYLQFHLLE